MPFTGLHLICPRCRRLEDGELIRHPLTTGTARGEQPAHPGALDGIHTLTCTNPACHAHYPVYDGIPVIFRDPNALDFTLGPPVDLLALPVEALRATVLGQPPGAPLPTLLSRLARYAWAGFHDHIDPEIEVPGPAFGVHAVELMAWVEGLGEPDRCRDGLRAVLGCAFGREAWEAKTGATLLIDAWMPGLLGAKRLMRDGKLELLMPVDTVHQAPVRVEVPAPPRTPVALVCCDVLDPPFEAEGFASVIAANLIDSVSDPYVAIGQSHAMVAPRGMLTLTSPFAWRTEITPRHRWLESLLGREGMTAEEVLLTLLTRELAPPLEPLDRHEFTWALRASGREQVLYRSTGWCLTRG